VLAHGRHERSVGSHRGRYRLASGAFVASRWRRINDVLDRSPPPLLHLPSIPSPSHRRRATPPASPHIHFGNRGGREVQVTLSENVPPSRADDAASASDCSRRS
jgi:hypothetical protein